MRFSGIIILVLFTLRVVAQPFTEYGKNSEIIHPKVNCIEAGKDFVWIGTDGGINRVVISNNEVVKFSPRGTSVPVLSIADDNDILWIGLKGKGVYKMPKNNYKFIGFRKDVLGDKTITRLEKKGDNLKVFTPENTYVFDVKANTYKVLKSEVFNYAPKIKVKKKTLKVLNGEVLRYNEPTQTSKSFKTKFKVFCHLVRDGAVIFGSNKGLQFYNSNKDTITFKSPAIALKSTVLNGTDTVLHGAKLPWGDHIIQLGFDFIELGGAEEITLISTIKGPAGKKELTQLASAPYELKNLDHGSYSIKITAKNEIGVSAENTLQLKFSIANPTTSMVLEYLLYFVIIAAWTAGVILLTQRKLKRDIRVLEDALLAKTNKLNQLEKGNYGLVEEDQL